MDKKEVVYSAQEVADILKIKKNTVYNMIKRGDLNAYKIGNKMRISNFEIERYKKRSLNHPLPENDNQDIKTINQITSPSQNIIDEPIFTQSGFIICGQDTALDTLANHLQNEPGGNKVLRSYVGSYNGLYMLYNGQASIATSHLWDGKTNTYNIPYVQYLLPGVPTIIIHLLKRTQGFYVRSGNPKNIKSWEDLKRNDISIINRERGSGTRVLLDEHLRLMNINPMYIQGYNKECFSHLAVAGAVARGSSDFGIGTIASTKLIPGIEFIPLQQESYDIVIKKEDLNKPLFQSVINIISSESYRIELEGTNEYDLSNLGKIVAEI